jgi:hypothetical protein
LHKNAMLDPATVQNVCSWMLDTKTRIDVPSRTNSPKLISIMIVIDDVRPDISSDQWQRHITVQTFARLLHKAWLSCNDDERRLVDGCLRIA